MAAYSDTDELIAVANSNGTITICRVVKDPKDVQRYRAPVGFMDIRSKKGAGRDGNEAPRPMTTFAQVLKHAVKRGGEGWYDTLVRFGLQLTAPIGRSPLTALPLDPFPS